MRRRIAAALLAVVALAAVVAWPASGESDYRVDVIFDDSRGLLVGQLVQIAGARVGDIVDVTVTDDYKARVHLKIDSEFAPFREDATCTIRPSGLIAENYVQCDPGSPDAEPLRGEDGAAPTVPVDQTTQPVSLTDLFEVWNTPTRERLQVLMSTLGISLAGRGEDLNAVLRRANPSLALARRAIALLERQRDDLVTIVDRAERVMDEVAERPERVSGLLRHTARVLRQTATRRGELAAGIRELPGLLEQAQPALAKLGALSASATPLVRRLREAAPALNRASADIPRLADAARPTLAKLAPVLRSGATTARNTAPLAALVARYTRQSLPSTAIAGEMLPTLERRGFVTSLLRFLYTATMASARFDEQGHIIPAHVQFTECGLYATVPDTDCGAPVDGTRRAARRTPRERRPEDGKPTPAPLPTATPDLPKLPRVPDLPKVPKLPRVPDLPQLRGGGGTPQDTVDDLLDFLFG